MVIHNIFMNDTSCIACPYCVKPLPNTHEICILKKQVRQVAVHLVEYMHDQSQIYRCSVIDINKGLLYSIM